MVISTRYISADFHASSRRIDVWNPIQGTRLKSFKDYKPGVPNRYDEDVLAVSPDGRLLAYPSKYGRSVKVRDITTGIHWSIWMNGGIDDECERMDSTPDGQQLVTVNRVGISFWVYTGEGDGCWVSQRTLEQKKDEVNSISFSPDGRLLAICFCTLPKYEGASYGCAVDIWEWTTGFLVQILETCRRVLTSVAFSTNGKLLARERWVGAMDGKNCMDYGPIIEPWDLSTGKLHPDLVVEGRYEDTDGVVTSLPPINDL
jgi:WD40 repeat protein